MTALNVDPRYYQLIVQASLILWGVFYLESKLPLSHILAGFSVSLIMQVAFTRYLSLPTNLLSTLNSTLSILILLHANSWIWIMLACFVAISSKFIIRYNNKHIFNPSNLGIVAVLLLTSSAWVAPGQWGQAAWFILLMAGLGLIFIMGFSRMLTSISFLVTFVGITLLRAFWLGDPLPVPLNQLQNGALLIFTFFMLSDPMTTPSNNTSRLIFGIWLAITSAILLFGFYIPNAFLYALALSMPLVLLLNHYFTGRHYHWPREYHYEK